MKRITIDVPAGEIERVDPGALDQSIGQPFYLNIEGAEPAVGTVIDASVSEDGSRAKLTIEAPDEAIPDYGIDIPE